MVSLVEEYYGGHLVREEPRKNNSGCLFLEVAIPAGEYDSGHLVQEEPRKNNRGCLFLEVAVQLTFESISNSSDKVIAKGLRATVSNRPSVHGRLSSQVITITASFRGSHGWHSAQLMPAIIIIGHKRLQVRVVH